MLTRMTGPRSTGTARQSTWLAVGVVAGAFTVVGVALAVRALCTRAPGAAGSSVAYGQEAWALAQAQPVPGGHLPYVVGMTFAQAQTRLREAGYSRVVVANPDAIHADLVLDMEPWAGTEAPSGSVIALTLAEITPIDDGADAGDADLPQARSSGAWPASPAGIDQDAEAVVTTRFGWVDELEDFALVLVHDLDAAQLAELLGPTGEATEANSDPLSYVQFTCAEDSGWAYAASFDPFLTSPKRLSRLEDGRDAVSFWFNIKANSEFRVVRQGNLIRSFEVIGFEGRVGEPLPDESELFAGLEFVAPSDALELLARLTGTEPSISWFPGEGGTVLATKAEW